MAKMHPYISKLGFSILIPDGWDYTENLDKIDMAEKERESQKKWLLIKDGPDSPEKAAKMFLEMLGGMSTGMQVVIATSRKVFYEELLILGVERPKGSIFDKSTATQIQFLLLPHEIALKEWSGKLTATRLLITLQELTEEARLRAKEHLGFQEGYFIVANEKNPDHPAMTVVKLSMRENQTSSQLYSIYHQCLPVWFWSGIPDKVKTVKNKTVDNGEMTVVENYLSFNETDSLSIYAAKGMTGWVISCTGLGFNFHHHKSLFEKMIESFRVEQN
ncbi:MAG: hypothetical protein HYX82_03185 [Chloroflexi bacterium]|nr:hypothetical protein [Chloroflexota bacterium]